MSGQDVFQGVKKICQQYKDHRSFPSRLEIEDKADLAEMLDNMLMKANKALEPINMEIVKIQEEVKINNDSYNQFYVLNITDPNESIAKLQKHYGEPEMEWLKLAAIHLADETGGERLEHSGNKLVNLCMHGGNNKASYHSTSTAVNDVRSMLTVSF